MTDEADEALLRRLQNVANYLRRTEPAVAEDMKAAIRYEQSSPEGRENMRADRTFGSLISRLEKRAARAIAENHPLANESADSCGTNTQTMNAGQHRNPRQGPGGGQGCAPHVAVR